MNRKSFLRSFVAASLGSLVLNNRSAASPTEEMSLKSSYIIPPYLKPGDTVGITCPAGNVELAKVQCCGAALEKWGLKVKYGKTVGKQWQRFGGTDQERLEDFQALIDDETVKAIIFGKGGYGTMRIIDQVNWDKFKMRPKWLVGYSDLTVVHLHLHSNLNICTIHGDMSNGFSENAFDPSATSLNNALFGNALRYDIKSYEMNRTGTAQGKLIGGNLTLLNACAGSKSDINTRGKILFIEDVSEYKYNIDRMMMSLKRSGKLDKLAGLVVGAFTATKDDVENTFNLKLEEIIWEKVKEYDYPVCFHFPAGHIVDNRAIKMGVNYTLNVGRETVNLSEVPITATTEVSTANIFIQ